MAFHPRTIAPFALALAAMSGGSPARAADKVYSIRVHYASSELASPAGADAVYGRIAAAARHSCAGVGRVSLTDVALARMCRRELVARAVARVDSPLLAAVHDGRGAIRLAARGQD